VGGNGKGHSEKDKRVGGYSSDQSECTNFKEREGGGLEGKETPGHTQLLT